MNIKSFKTLLGMTIDDFRKALDAPLPAGAYKPVPGGAGLTDIDPGYMRQVLNDIFGVCGVGWGYAYDSADVSAEVEERSSTNGGKRRVYVVSVKKLIFWYKIVDTDGAEIVAEIPSSGGSENSVEGFALSGAITNAIGKAVSNIGFQESVYLGKRTHLNVGKPAPVKASATSKPAPAPTSKPAPAKAPASAPKPAAPASKPAPKAPAPDDEIVDAPAPVNNDAAPAAEGEGSFDDPASYVINIGTRKGQKLGEMDATLVEWYAHTMKATNDEAKALKAAAEALMKIRSNGHEPVAA